ncbi:MAG: type I-C CRISPR-associated protein Cas5 [Myxococcales bacterium]|nr:type I-C CRISPR-associated protein Cas5 [Myxococcales bacterium]
MQGQRSPTLRLRARGPLACFTRPELKVERVSYPVMTPSAARGLVEAVLWKPAIRWRIERIGVLAPIRFTSFRRNEVNRKAAVPARAVIEGGGPAPVYFADEDRAQRNTVALRDVDYVVEARFEMTERAGSDDNVNKFVEMFTRRVARGQRFHQPYFGCREFVADVLNADGAPDPVADSRELGIMLWDIEFGPKRNTPRFFRARLVDGVLEVPEDPDATFTDGEAAA